MAFLKDEISNVLQLERGKNYSRTLIAHSSHPFSETNRIPVGVPGKPKRSFHSGCWSYLWRRSWMWRGTGSTFWRKGLCTDISETHKGRYAQECEEHQYCPWEWCGTARWTDYWCLLWPGVNAWLLCHRGWASRPSGTAREQMSPELTTKTWAVKRRQNSLWNGDLRHTEKTGFSAWN